MKKRIVFELMRTVLGLAIFSFGVYMTIQASIGVAPWDTLTLGVCAHVPMTYGQVHIIISVLILAVDLLMKEKIGFSTVLDAFLVGIFVDIFTHFDIIPERTTLISGIVLMVAGMFVLALGQYFYMSAAQCCGPRDSFVVGVGRRLRRLPIGAVEVIIFVAVFLAGWRLGAPVGIGTVISTFGLGVAMQIIFSLFNFEPRDVRHKSIVEAVKILSGRTDSLR